MTQQKKWFEAAHERAQFVILINPKTLMSHWNEKGSGLLFLCNDIKETFGRLSSNVVKLAQHPTKMPWGPYAMFVDVDGNEFILIGKGE